MKSNEFIVHRVLRRPYKLVLRADTGRGEPILLLHGLASSSSAWTPLVQQINLNKYHVIAFDLLGFGRSPKPGWAQYSAKQHAAAVKLSLRKRKLKKPVTVIGHSMGCLVAIQLATQYPKLIQRVILYEPPLFMDLPRFRSHMRYRKGYFALYRKVAGNQKVVIRYARTLGRIAARLPGHNLTEETWLPFERSLRKTIIDQEPYQKLISITIPTDIVYGRMDMIVPRTGIRKILSANSYIKFHTISESHWISPRAAQYLLKILDTAAN